MRASIAGSNSSILFRLENGVTPTSLSVDWITGNIYYTDSRGEIGVVSEDGYHQAVISKNLGAISDLVVNPLAG